MKLVKVTFGVSVVAVLAMLGGCVAVPVGPGYYAEPPGYYAAPAYYGPSIGIGVYGGRRDFGRRHWRR